MPAEPRTSTKTEFPLATLLACDACEVTWREAPGSLCWLCERPGYVVSPERLVLEF